VFSACLALACAGVASALAAGPDDAMLPSKAALAGEASDWDGSEGAADGGPPNDDILQAQTLECNSSVVFNTSGATPFDASEPAFSCHRFGPFQNGFYTVWFTFVATGSQADLSLCNPGTAVLDTILAVYSFSGGLTEIACNEDGGAGCGLEGFQSRVTATGLTPGQTYYVQVGGSAPEFGQMELTLACAVNGDFCGGAQLIGCGSAVTFNTSSLTTSSSDPIFSCRVGGPQQGFYTAWFTFVAPANQADLSLCNPGTSVPDTLLAVYSGSCGDLTEIACNDDAGCEPSGDRSRVTATGLTPGQIYYVQVAGSDPNQFGQIELTLVCSNFVDDCTGAQPIACNSSVTFDNSSFTDNPFDPAFSCYVGGPARGSNTAWFTFTATSSLADLSLCNPGTLAEFTLLAVYSGSCGDLTEIACNREGGPGCGPFESQSRVAATGLTPGQTYYVQVASVLSFGIGQVELTLACPANPDFCIAAQPIACNSGVILDNSSFTTDPSDPVFSCRDWGPQQGFYTAWFTFTASGAQADLSLCNPVTFVEDTLLAVYSGSCGAFTEIACSDDAFGGDCGPSGFQSRLSVAGLTPGQTYYIQAAGWDASQFGLIQLTLDCGTLVVDCNANGVNDAQDIAAGTSRDCFNAAAAPGTAGGPDGVPDECECLADWDRNGVANSTDVSELINTFFADQAGGTTFADIDCNGVSNSTDVSEFINVFFAAQAGQLPFAGCAI
jgi:hypothetical protein